MNLPECSYLLSLGFTVEIKGNTDIFFSKGKFRYHHIPKAGGRLTGHSIEDGALAARQWVFERVEKQIDWNQDWSIQCSEETDP